MSMPLRHALLPLLLASALAAAADESTSTLSAGKPLPTFAGYGPGGNLVSLKQLLTPARDPPAKALVVSFFATWCVPCGHGLPVIQRVVDELAADQVRGVLIAYGEEGEKVTSYLKQKDLTLPVVLDPYMKISQRFGVTRNLPWTFVVDAKGTVRKVFHVESPSFDKELRAAILDAMK